MKESREPLILSTRRNRRRVVPIEEDYEGKQ